MITDVYYGAKALPKGKRRPSMKESAEKSQVRYYGIKKIDSVTLNAFSGQSAKNKKKKLTLQTQIVKLSGKKQKLNNNLPYASTKEEKKEIEKEMKELEKQIKEKTEEIKILE